MADSTTSKKKPLSLNDRYHRLLQDLSAPPKPSRATAADEKEGDEDENPSTIEPENQRRVSKVSSIVDEFDDIRVPQSSAEENPRKVKINGRRRLCKLSSREDGDLDNPVGFDFIEPIFSGITDFDSPSPPPPPPVDYPDNKGSEIKDILNNLSTRLELLSFEKKREKPRKIDSLGDFSASYYGKGIEEAIKAGDCEVDSPKFSSNPSNSLLDENVEVENVVQTLNYGVDGEYEEEILSYKVEVEKPRKTDSLEDFSASYYRKGLEEANKPEDREVDSLKIPSNPSNSLLDENVKVKNVVKTLNDGVDGEYGEGILPNKTKVEKPRKIDSLGDFSASYYRKGIEEANKADDREVDRPKFSSNPSNSLLDENVKVGNVVKTFNDGVDDEYGDEILPNKVKVKVFEKEIHEVDTCSKESEQLINALNGSNKHHGGRDKYMRQDVERSYNSLGKTHVLKDEEGEVDEDDCVVLQRETRDFNEVMCSKESEQLLNLKYRNNKHHEGRDKHMRQDVERTYNFLGKTPVVKNKKVEVEDEDDCVVLPRETRDFKEVRRQHGKYEEKNDNSDGIVMSDKSADDYILEGKNSIGHNSAFKLQGRIAKMLFPHQRDGLRWLWSLHCQGKGGILGDDMGLGKTMQICGFLAGLFYSRLIKRVLVVAPKTLLPHWIKELSVVGLSEKTREYYGPSAKLRQYELNYILQGKGVLLTTYDIVRNNSKSLQGNGFSEDEDIEDGTTWDYMILDEGHLIKNPSTQRAKSLLEIPSAHRIIISGTPLQNNLKELWALFNFCCPDLLGDNKWFKEYYECAILRGNDKRASERDKRIGSMAAKELRERIQPYFLRRMKSEVFNEDNDQATTKLSKKNDIIVWLRLTSCQRRLYEAYLSSELVLSAFDGSPLAALTILKKICDHPLLLTKRAAKDVLEGMETVLSPEDAGVAEKLAMHLADVADREFYGVLNDNVSCKISFIMSLLDNLVPKGHNVLIFSQTRKMLNLIEESLSSKNYEFLRIDGTTKATDRVKIVNDFQEGRGASIFLLTSQVGGLGLTLTRADRVIVVDPAWNPSTDNQSVDRAYRIGQKKDVIVYRLMTCGTVEEKIYRKQIYKGGLFKTATEHKEQIRYFSQQDLREIFSLPKEGFDISVTQQQLHEEHDQEFTMDDSLRCHIKFLETQGIAGVSHHNLLFSKTAPEPLHALDEEDTSFRRNQEVAYRERATSSSSSDLDVDGAKFAFNPKDVKLNRFTTNASSPGKQTEKDIKEKINRLSQTLQNKVLVSRLTDSGDRIQKKIVALNLELSELRRKEYESEVIDITDNLQKVLNV